MRGLTLGHGPIRLENGQLRDNLSRLWCSCGNPAIEYVSDNEPPYDFVCIGHLPKASNSTEQPSEAAAEEEVYGNDCRTGNCS